MVKITGYIKTIFSTLYYRINTHIENIRGFDFSTKESIDTLGLDKNKSEQYESTKVLELKIWLKKIPDNDYIAIDFGSGKGLVLVELLKNKMFEYVYGVEISQKLNYISKNNLTIFNNYNSVELLTIDAIDTPMEIISKSNFFFFYNPFPESIFKKVFERIERSISINPRDIVLIYFNPLYSDIITESIIFNNPKIIHNILSNADTHIYIVDKK